MFSFSLGTPSKKMEQANLPGGEGASDNDFASLFKGISESSFPLDGEHIYGSVYTDSYVEIFPGPNYYHNYTSYIDNGILSI